MRQMVGEAQRSAGRDMRGEGDDRRHDCTDKMHERGSETREAKERGGQISKNSDQSR